MMRCARFGLFLYLFTVPWTLVFFSWSGHDYARILQVGVAGLAGLALLWEGWRGWSPRLPRWGLALLVTGLLAAGLSIAQAPEPVWAWREAALFAGMVCIAALIGLDDRVHPQGVVQAAALAFAAYVSLEFLVINLGLTQGVAIPSMDFALGYDNPRFFNHVTTVALPVCLAAVLQGDDLPWRRRLASWGLIGGLALTFWSGGRAVLVAQAAGLLVATAALGLQRARPLLRAALVSALWAVALYLLQFILLPWVLHLSSEFVWTARIRDGNSVGTRLFLWRLAIGDWVQAPWFGVGPMHFAHVPNFDAAHPHNIYLQTLAEWGGDCLCIGTGCVVECAVSIDLGLASAGGPSLCWRNYRWQSAGRIGRCSGGRLLFRQFRDACIPGMDCGVVRRFVAMAPGHRSAGPYGPGSDGVTFAEGASPASRCLRAGLLSADSLDELDQPAGRLSFEGRA